MAIGSRRPVLWFLLVDIGGGLRGLLEPREELASTGSGLPCTASRVAQAHTCGRSLPLLPDSVSPQGQ